MSKKKTIICTVLLTFVVCVVAMMLYKIETTNGFNLGRSISIFLVGWCVGERIIEFYYWLLRKNV